MSADLTRSVSRRMLSLDGWAVVLALLLAAAVRAGVLPSVTW